MKRVFGYMICALCIAINSKAQNLDVIELGSIMGEMGSFHSSLTWHNTSDDTVRLNFWASREELTFEKKSALVLPKSEMLVAYAIGLEGTSGEEVYEIRLIGEEQIVLHGFLLKARVFEAEEDVFKAYRNDFFPFRSTGQVFNLKSGFRGDKLSEKFSLYNFGGKTLNMEGVLTSIPGIKVSFEPEEIPHNSFSRITISLQSNSEHALGFTRDKLQLINSDSTVLAILPVQFTLEQTPEYGRHTEAPHLALSKLTHDFRVMKAGDYESVNITISNTGRGPLKIEALEANCDCLEYELDSREVAQGSSVSLKVSFNAANRLGYERKTLALFTNDPNQPTRVLTFKAHVK
ncbi:MAG: DUF1573 domain-containing protein [Roseivirga sp.]|nr:DUF1573 domain-containing protein [Roseivirga sp.]